MLGAKKWGWLAGVAWAIAAMGCETDQIGPLPEPGGEQIDEPDALEAAADALRFMREEEKLARDVYRANDARYGVQIFGNIAQAEQTHMDAVLALLDARDLEDPAADTAEGEFVDPALADLFDALDERSQRSLMDALEVGAEIEEIDIRDLADLAAAVGDADILQTFAELERGSRNHLRAYVGQLRQRGVDYEARYLDPELFAEILGAEQERGGGQGRGR